MLSREYCKWIVALNLDFYDIFSNLLEILYVNELLKFVLFSG